MESDFKCSCPGEDEADLLVRLAALAGLEISTRFQQYDDEGKTIVWASYQPRAELKQPLVVRRVFHEPIHALAHSFLRKAREEDVGAVLTQVFDDGREVPLHHVDVVLVLVLLQRLLCALAVVVGQPLDEVQL